MMIVSWFRLGLLCATVVPILLADSDIVPAEDVSALLLKLREDVKTIKESYRGALADAMDKNKQEIRKHELEIEELRKTVLNLEEQVKVFQRNERDSAELTRIGSSAVVARSCAQLLLSDQSLQSGMYWIDPDGHATGDNPIYVFCNTTSGSTSIAHDSESTTDVGHCWDAGCYGRSIEYKATMRQIVALMELSSICTQKIKYECKMAPIEFNGIAQSWWTDRNGIRKYDFTGGDSDVSKCQCGGDKSCLDRDLLCNCNALSPTETVDEGIIMDKSALPVTRLNFGRILNQPASGRYTLSRLECFGQELPIHLPRPPRSCQDLWRAGHTTSGFYFIQQDKDVKTVFCDMTQLPGQERAMMTIVSADQQESLIRSVEKIDRDISDQASELHGLKSQINQFSSSLARQNQSIITQSRKFESMDGKLAKDYKILATNQQKLSADLVNLRTKSTQRRTNSINRIPETCGDLYTIGQTVSGLYPVKGDDHIAMVFCDMSKAVPVERLIGKVDIKSSPVYFYVQRKSPFYVEGGGRFNSVLTFEITRSNQGEGMNARTGIFSVPKSGTYVFAFGAIKHHKAQHVDIYLRLNDAENVASVYGSEHNGYFTLSLQSILSLKKNDRLCLIVKSAAGGGIYDDDDMTTYFSGFLLEEKLFD